MELDFDPKSAVLPILGFQAVSIFKSLVVAPAEPLCNDCTSFQLTELFLSLKYGFPFVA